MSDFIPAIAGSGGPEIFGEEYSTKVLTTERANLIAYWPLGEATGSTADNIEGTAARDGTYINTPTLGQTGIGDGGTAPLFDPASSECVNVYSASFRDAWNGAEGTMAIWYKVRAASVLVDGTNRYFFIVRADNNNQHRIFKSTTDNQFRCNTTAGSTSKSIDIVITSTDWVHLAITWSESEDEVKAYVNGAQSGSTLDTLGDWSGNPASGNTALAAQSSVGGLPWDGYNAHAVVWTTPLSAPQIANLAIV